MAPRRLCFRPNVPRLAGAALLIAAVLAVLWQGLLLAVAALFPEPAAAGFGTLEVGERVVAVALRWEQAVPAPVAGRFRPIHPGGERIAHAAVIGEISRSGRRPVACRAPGTGLVSYTVDGLETACSPDAALGDPAAAYLLARRSRLRRVGGGPVRQHQAVARLVDDQEQFLLCRIPNWRNQVVVGQTVWAREHDGLIPLAVAKVVPDKEMAWVFLRTERFPRAWLDRRLIPLQAVWKRGAGTLVPVRYLRREDSRTGVWILVNRRPCYVKVEVLVEDRYQALVRGLRPGEMLVR